LFDQGSLSLYHGFTVKRVDYVNSENFYYLFLVPMDLSVNAKATLLGALFLIVRVLTFFVSQL